MSAIIECKNLTHYYGQRKIYENLSFEVPQGRILGLLGKNGTGKTTTINILSGYLQPRSGECRIFGENIQTMNPALRRNIGLLLEGHVQYQFMNITQIEKFYASFYPGQWKKEAYYGLMNKLKVAPGQRISRMSNGQRSQVALGLPCPNLGTGGHAYHGPYEHITAEGMDAAVNVTLEIIRLFSQKKV